MGIIHQDWHRTGYQFLGLKVPDVGFLIVEELNKILDKNTPDKTCSYIWMEFDLACILSVSRKI